MSPTPPRATSSVEEAERQTGVDPVTRQEPGRPGPADLIRVVALDGPAGSGKTTVARRVAAALGWRFVDTGATYRAVTLAVLRAGVSPTDAAAVVEAARRCDIDLGTDPDASWVRLDGEDVSREIRGPAVTAHVSAVSAVPEVRQVLVALQRGLMGREGAVVEGRDIATVVAPSAGVKVYLDASPEVRARRRAGDADTGVGLSDRDVREAVVETDLRRRDALDHQTNPLKASDGAVHIDTDALTLDEVVGLVVAMVHEAGLAERAAGESVSTGDRGA